MLISPMQHANDNNIKTTKRARQRQAAIKLMQDHYKLTGLNLYFRNAIHHYLKENIRDCVRSLEEDGTVMRIKVKGAVAYKLTNLEFDNKSQD